MARRKNYGTGIPDYEIDAIARCLLPKIQKFYESEEGRREFEEWKQKQEEQKSSVKKKNWI